MHACLMFCSRVNVILYQLSFLISACLLCRCYCALCQLDEAFQTSHHINSDMFEGRSFFHHYLGLDCASELQRIQNEHSCRKILREEVMVSSSLTLGRFMASFLVCHHVLKQAAQKATVSQRSILRLLWECRTNCTPGDDDAHEKWRTTVLNKTRSYSNLSLAPDVMLNFIQHLLDDKSNVHEMDKEFMPDLASAPTPHKAHKDTYVSTKKRQQGSVIKLSVPRRRAVTGNASKPGPDYKSLAEKRLRWIKQHKKVIREAKIEKDIFKDINSKATPQGILEWNSMYSERAQPSRRGQHPTNDGSGKQLLDLADEMDLLVKSRQTYENSLAAVQDLKLSLQQKSNEWSRRIGRAKKSLRASKSVQCREQALHIQQNRMRKQKCMLKKKSAKIKACSKDIAEREEAVTMPTCTVKERQLLDHLRGFCRDAGERHSNQMRELSYDLLSDHTQGAVKDMLEKMVQHLQLDTTLGVTAVSATCLGDFVVEMNGIAKLHCATMIRNSSARAGSWDGGNDQFCKQVAMSMSIVSDDAEG